MKHASESVQKNDADTPKGPDHRIIFFLKVFRIVCAAAPFLALGILFLWFFAPGGRMVIRYDLGPDETSKIISGFASKEPYRLIGETVNELGKDYFQLITVDPVYFSVPAFRNWQQVTVKLLYQNPENHPKVNLGVQGSDAGYSFERLINFDERLEMLRPFWKKIERDGVVLWQKDAKQYRAFAEERDRRVSDLLKEKIDELTESQKSPSKEEREKAEKAALAEAENQLVNFDFEALPPAQTRYQSINEFLTNPPDANEIVLFDYDWSRYERIPGYRASSRRTVMSKSLRGSHTIATYVGDGEDLDFVFRISEINRHGDDDSMTVKITHGGSTVFEDLVPDDGIRGASGRTSSEKTYAIKLPSPEEGLYTISLVTTDDTFITSFDTQQHLFLFKNSIYLAENEEYQDVLGTKDYSPTTLFVSSERIQASTSHEKSKQTIRGQSFRIVLTKTHELFTIDDIQETQEVEVPKNDVYIKAASIAFSAGQLFESAVVYPTVLEAVDRPIDDYSYIIANYKPPQYSHGIGVASTIVRVPSLIRHDGQYRFIINLPGLSEQNRHFHIYGVEMIFEREPITLKNLFPRMADYLRRNIKY